MNINSSNIPDYILSQLDLNKNRLNTVPYFVGICGASGSGKTFIANIIKEVLETESMSKNDISIISQDSYYIGGTNSTNYDIPQSIDFDRLHNDLVLLNKGEVVQLPIYDFTIHKRLDNTIPFNPTRIIIVEGILIFNDIIRNFFHLKVFVEASIPTQIFRRISRDVYERNRDLKDVNTRYEQHVWPSYEKYVGPSRQYADIIINNQNNCFVGLTILLSYLKSI